jgi:hypothetical protein
VATAAAVTVAAGVDVGVAVAGEAPHAVSITHSARVSRNSRNRTVARLYGGDVWQPCPRCLLRGTGSHAAQGVATS